MCIHFNIPPNRHLVFFVVSVTLLIQISLILRSSLSSVFFFLVFFLPGVVIGFVYEVVTVAEDGGNAVLTVVLNGALQRNVTVKLTTSSDTALGINASNRKVM